MCELKHSMTFIYKNYYYYRDKKTVVDGGCALEQGAIYDSLY